MALAVVPIPEGSDFPLENLPYGVFSTKDNVRLHDRVTVHSIFFCRPCLSPYLLLLVSHNHQHSFSRQYCNPAIALKLVTE